MKLISEKKRGSYQVIIPADVAENYPFEKEIEAELLSIGILLKTSIKPRSNWAKLFKTGTTEATPFFLNNNDEKEWQW